MSTQTKRFQVLVIMFVLIALTFCHPSTAQSSPPPQPFYIRASGGVSGGVDFHPGTYPSGTDNLYTYSDLVTPTYEGGPFSTRLNYTIHIQYHWIVGNFTYQYHRQSGSYGGHQVSGGEEYQFGLNWTATNVQNHVTADPTAWFGQDVDHSNGVPQLLGIKYYYEYFASMEDDRFLGPVGICTWQSASITSLVVTYGEPPPDGWAY